MICSEEFLSVIENENLESLRNQTRLRQTGNLHIFASQSIIYFGLNSHTIKLTLQFPVTTEIRWILHAMFAGAYMFP